MQGHHQDLQTEALVGRAVSPRTKQQGSTREEAGATIAVEEIGIEVEVKDTEAPLRLALPFGAQIAMGLLPSCLPAATPNATCATKR